MSSLIAMTIVILAIIGIVATFLISDKIFMKKVEKEAEELRKKFREEHELEEEE